MWCLWLAVLLRQRAGGLLRLLRLAEKPCVG
jgi:hypothetical protein